MIEPISLAESQRILFMTPEEVEGERLRELTKFPGTGIPSLDPLPGDIVEDSHHEELSSQGLIGRGGNPTPPEEFHEAFSAE